MQRITTVEFLKFCKSLEGQELHTIARRAKFTIQVVDTGLVLVPGSSNKPRSHTLSYVERLLEDFAKSDSCKPSDYSGYTANASYQLSPIYKYMKCVV